MEKSIKHAIKQNLIESEIAQYENEIEFYRYLTNSKNSKIKTSSLKKIKIYEKKIYKLRNNQGN